jgi:DNA polymerase III sliding clamp (beta) subunit (PCNA family)
MKLPKQHIEAVMAREETGYTLQAVHFDAEKEILIATDGHALAAIPALAEKLDQTGLISGRAWKVARAAQRRIPKKMRGAKVSASFQVLKHKLLVRGHDETTVLPKPTGSFPDTSALFKDFKPQFCVSFNVELLHNLSVALSEPGDSPVVTLIVQGECKAIGVLAHQASGVGLLMPCRTEEADFPKRCRELKLIPKD